MSSIVKVKQRLASRVACGQMSKLNQFHFYVTVLTRVSNFKANELREYHTPSKIGHSKARADYIDLALSVDMR